MTAIRGLSADLARSSSIGAPRRYQPYLANINTDRATWQAGYPISHPPSLTLASPASTEPNSASTPALAMTPASFASATGPASGSGAYDSGNPAPQYPYYSAAGAPHNAYSATNYGIANDFAAQPRSLAGGYAAFGPTGASPTVGSPSSGMYGSTAVGSRRHTVSGFSPSPDSAGPMSGEAVEEVIVKEEKRRRNKESSQRFRDRTRERQREKQERLEYLERRVKDLEETLKDARGAAPSTRAVIGDNETAVTALQRLQRENDGLRAALKTAEQEIIRIRPGVTSNHSSFNASQFYNSLPQLSPGGSSQALSETPSPTADSVSYFVSSGTTTGSNNQDTPLTTAQSTRMHVDYPYSDARGASVEAIQHQHTAHGRYNLSAPASANGDRQPTAPWLDHSGPASSGPTAMQTSWPSDDKA